MTPFDRCMEFVLKWEGGVANIKGDIGGATFFGIASKFHPEEAKQMKALIDKGDVEGAKAIALAVYKKEYWDVLRCDSLSWPLCLVVMDTGVNCGVSRALTWLKSYPDWNDYLMIRLKFHNDSPREDIDDGWINRITEIDPNKRGLYWFIKDSEHPLSGVTQ